MSGCCGSGEMPDCIASSTAPSDHTPSQIEIYNGLMQVCRRWVRGEYSSALEEFERVGALMRKEVGESPPKPKIVGRAAVLGEHHVIGGPL